MRPSGIWTMPRLVLRYHTRPRLRMTKQQNRKRPLMSSSEPYKAVTQVGRVSNLR